MSEKVDNQGEESPEIQNHPSDEQTAAAAAGASSPNAASESTVPVTSTPLPEGFPHRRELVEANGVETVEALQKIKPEEIQLLKKIGVKKAKEISEALVALITRESPEAVKRRQRKEFFARERAGYQDRVSLEDSVHRKEAGIEPVEEK
jgi:hypothetical protein